MGGNHQHGDSPINIKGYGLSDRADKITFVFPDLTLAAGEHVIVFASDSTQNEAGETLHAKFKLSSAGDKLFLFGSDGIAFQELDVPAMDYNMSYTWIDGNDYIITDQYTPGYDNTQEGYAAFRSSTVLQSGALVINEICASSITTLKDEDGDYPDWIEIHNTTNQAIDLSNYALSDSTDKLVKWRFPQAASSRRTAISSSLPPRRIAPQRREVGRTPVLNCAPTAKPSFFRTFRVDDRHGDL